MQLSESSTVATFNLGIRGINDCDCCNNSTRQVKRTWTKPMISRKFSSTSSCKIGISHAVCCGTQNAALYTATIGTLWIKTKLDLSSQELSKPPIVHLLSDCFWRHVITVKPRSFPKYHVRSARVTSCETSQALQRGSLRSCGIFFGSREAETSKGPQVCVRGGRHCPKPTTQELEGKQSQHTSETGLVRVETSLLELRVHYSLRSKSYSERILTFEESACQLARHQSSRFPSRLWESTKMTA